MKNIRQIFKAIIVKKEIDLSLEDIKLDGNILDVSVNNQGIIYNLCKNTNGNKDIKTEYFRNNSKAVCITGEEYDNIVLFFTLENLGFNSYIKKLISEVTNYLKEGGYINIWDMEKERWSYRNVKLNILLPGKVIKRMNIKNFNILRNSSSKRIREILEKDFDIIEFASQDNIYYIKGKKKGRTTDESSAGSN